MTTAPAPSRAEMIDRARAMIPTLRKRALEAERERRIPLETHREFQAAGFYKLFQPARHGGHEMPLGTMVDVAGELGRGCGSSAWIFTNLAVQNAEVDVVLKTRNRAHVGEIVEALGRCGFKARAYPLEQTTGENP